jgi:hypothetical protein
MVSPTDPAVTSCSIHNTYDLGTTTLGLISPDLKLLSAGVPGAGGLENLVWTKGFMMPYSFLSKASYSSRNSSMAKRCDRMMVGSNSPLSIFLSSSFQYFWTGAWPVPRRVMPFSCTWISWILGRKRILTYHESTN